MAKLVKSIYTGSDVTSLGEVTSSDTIADAMTWDAEQTFKEITETQPSGTSGTTYTVSLANGTIFNLTNAASVAITMPDEAAGKSFTIIAKTAPSWISTPTIKWASDTVPSATTISIYSFICDGTTWFGMEAGNGFPT